MVFFDIIIIITAYTIYLTRIHIYLYIKNIGINSLAYGHRDITKSIQSNEHQEDAANVEHSTNKEIAPGYLMLDEEENDEEFPCGISPSMSLVDSHQGFYYYYLKYLLNILYIVRIICI